MIKKQCQFLVQRKPFGVTPEQIHSEVGSFGVPEFGTKFVRRNVSRHKTNHI